MQKSQKRKAKEPYVFYRIRIGERIINSTDRKEELEDLVAEARIEDKKAFVEAYGIEKIHDEIFGVINCLYHISGPDISKA